MARGGSYCEDKAPEATGFEIYTDEGFIGHASCTEMSNKCHGWINSTRVQLVCPVTCFLCDPANNHDHNGPPCYDAVVTGVKFQHGPKATCTQLASYCNHSTMGMHVQAACRLTCGLCEAHVGQPAGAGICRDMDSHDEPEFLIGGNLASCTDLMDFCSAGADNKNGYLVRSKCPRTCGTCASETTTSKLDLPREPESSNSGDMTAACDRRRRWGFCSTRRRRNF